MKIKRCCKCKIEKNIIEFHKNSKLQDGVRRDCKECRKKEHLRYGYILHPTIKQSKEELKKKKQKYYLKHKKYFHNLRAKNRKLYPWKAILERIRQRCNYQQNDNYKYYGERGIKCFITSEEIKFLWFRDEAYKMKQPSIHRINKDGNYELGNCCFLEQAEHTRKHKLNNNIK